MAKKDCAICGAEGYSYYPFCYKHLQEKKDGRIVKCEDCGKWYAAEESCECKKPKTIEGVCQKCGKPSGKYDLCKSCYYVLETKEEIQKETAKERVGNKCLRCGEPCGTNKLCENCFYGKTPQTKEKETSSIKTDGTKCKNCGTSSGKYDLCYDCYRKTVETGQNQYTRISQEDMTAFIESEKDSGIDVRKKWIPKIRCEDGHYVRSHAECRIDEWLRNHNIQHDYEKLVLSKKDNTKFLLCDFYIPDAKLYIEYWGYKDKATYQKRRAEKVAIYEDNGYIWRDLEDIHLEVLGDAMTQILLPFFPNLDDIKK